MVLLTRRQLVVGCFVSTLLLALIGLAMQRAGHAAYILFVDVAGAVRPPGVYEFPDERSGCDRPRRRLRPGSRTRDERIAAKPGLAVMAVRSEVSP